MTKEMIATIVRAGMQELLRMTRQERRKIAPWLTKKHIRWVLENPTWLTHADERAMEIIRHAAELLENDLANRQD